MIGAFPSDMFHGVANERIAAQNLTTASVTTMIGAFPSDMFHGVANEHITAQNLTTASVICDSSG